MTKAIPRLDLAVHEQVPSVPAARAALRDLRREVMSARTYAALQRILRGAEALEKLLYEVEEIRVEAQEWHACSGGNHH